LPLPRSAAEGVEDDRNMGDSELSGNLNGLIISSCAWKPRWNEEDLLLVRRHRH